MEDIENRMAGFSKEPPTEPGIYAVSNDEGWSVWRRVVVFKQDGKLRLAHPEYGKILGVTGLQGWMWRREA